jgi:hypothetical protein
LARDRQIFSTEVTGTALGSARLFLRLSGSILQGGAFVVSADIVGKQTGLASTNHRCCRFQLNRIANAGLFPALKGFLGSHLSVFVECEKSDFQARIATDGQENAAANAVKNLFYGPRYFASGDPGSAATRE